MEGKKAWTASHLYDDQCVDVRGVTVILADTFEFIIALLEVEWGQALQALPYFLFCLLYCISSIIIAKSLRSIIPQGYGYLKIGGSVLCCKKLLTSILPRFL